MNAKGNRLFFTAEVPLRLQALHTKDSHLEPQVVIDLRNRIAKADPAGYAYPRGGGGMPAAQDYGLVRVYTVGGNEDDPHSPLVNWEAFRGLWDAGEYQPLIDRILAGSNTVGRLEASALKAEEELIARLADAPRLSNHSGMAGARKASDYFDECNHSDLGLSAETTDEELQSIINRETLRAFEDDIVLAHLPEYLLAWREELRRSEAVDNGAQP